MKRLPIHFLIFLLFSFLAVFITYPLIFHLGSFATGKEDELLISWIYHSVTHNFFTNPLHLFDGTNFYPYDHTLAYSDIFLTTSILTAPFVYLINQPIAANNIVIIISLALLGFSTYLLTEYLTKNKLISSISGMLVIFSPAVLDKVIHVQLLASYFVILSFYFLFKYLDTGKYALFLTSIICFLLQTYNSFMPGYFIVMGYICIAILYFHKNRRLLLSRIDKKVVVTLICAGVFLLPICLPYIQVSKEFSYVRDIRDTVHFALQPEDLWYPNHATRLESLLQTISVKSIYNEEKVGYLGGVFSLLVLSSLILFFKQKKKSLPLVSLYFTAWIGLLLSFGPLLHIHRLTIHAPFLIPLPYILAYYILPGFQAFRASGRFEMLFILCIAVCCGVLVSTLLAKKEKTIQYIVCTLFIIGILAEFQMPFRYVKIPQMHEFPPVYAWLHTRPQEKVVIEMPIYTWNMQPYSSEEFIRQYYSTSITQRRVNGTSGFSPLPWEEMARTLLDKFPQESSLELLKKMKITYIVVHGEEYDMLETDHFPKEGSVVPSGEQIKHILQGRQDIQLVAQFGKDMVYEIR